MGLCMPSPSTNFLPLAPLVTARSNTFLIHRRRPLAIHPWVHGEHLEGLELSCRQCRLVGSLLARIHRHLAEPASTFQQSLWVSAPHTEQTLAKIDYLTERIG